MKIISIVLLMLPLLSIAQIQENNGNVGIGTNSPTRKLDVNGNVVFDRLGNPHTHFQLGHDVNDMIISDNSSNQHYGGGYFFRVHDESLQHKYRDVLMLTKTGKVGIGTTKPRGTFEVNGNIVFDRLGNPHTHFQLGHDVNDMIISDNSSNQHYGGGYFFRVHDESLNHKYRDVMMLTKTGKVGIGTTKPRGNFEVNGNVVFDRLGNPHTHFQLGHDVNDMIISDNSSNQHYGGGYFFRVHDESLNHKYRDVMMLTKTGKVGIGTRTTGNHRLAVEGSIGAREIKVESANWSDFVFDKEYELPTLSEVENHIRVNGHLKDIPSAEEVETNGFFLGQMDAKLLQKIEELTLYTIQQEKKIQHLEKENQELKAIKNRLLQLEQKLIGLVSVKW